MVKDRNFSGTTSLIVAAVLMIMFTLHNQMFVASLQYGDTCDADNQSSCAMSNLTCLSYNRTCGCANEYFRDDRNPNNIVCTKKSGYGEECVTGETFRSCNDTVNSCFPDLNDTKRCLCYSGFYRNPNGTCRSIDDLMVDKISSSSTTKSVTLTWTTDKHGMNVTYSVTSDQGQGHLEGPVTESGAKWTNMTSGRKYGFYINATIPADNYYSLMSVRLYKGDIWTVPAKPGPVTSVELIWEDPARSYKYKISFQGSTGDVAYYILTVDSENAKGTTTAYTFDTLHPGQNYSYAITAYNEIGNPSEVAVGTLRTNISYPGEVRNLTVKQDDITAQELTISFLCPDEKAFDGNIQGYRIQKALLNSDGQKEEDTAYRFYAEPTSCMISYSVHQVGGVIVERNYTFSVLTWNELYVGNFTPETHVYVQPRVPRLSVTSYDSVMLINQDSTSHNTEIELVLNVSRVLDASQGSVQDVGIIVCVVGDVNSCTGKDNRGLVEFSTWDYARRYDFSVTYRTTPFDWLQTLKSAPSRLIYTIGEETTCSSLPTTTYCNGPVPADKDLVISLVQCNNAGCGQVRYVNVVKTKGTTGSKTDLALALGLGLGLGCLVLIGGVAVGVVIYRRCTTSEPKHDYLEVMDIYSPARLPNPPPHRRVNNQPNIGYIDPVPDYFTAPSQLGGSTHTYLKPDEGDYDYVTIEEMANGIVNPGSEVFKNNDLAENHKNGGDIVLRYP